MAHMKVCKGFHRDHLEGQGDLVSIRPLAIRDPVQGPKTREQR